MVHYIVLDFETDFGEGIYGPDEVVRACLRLKAAAYGREGRGNRCRLLEDG
jgi:hypothetical protein